MNIYTFPLKLHALILVTVVCLAVLCGCGKSGMPSPKKTQDTFTITGAGISVMGDCLVARGTATGAIDNMSAVSIEVAAIQSYDDCPGCPFVPQEYSELAASDIQLDLESGGFMFSYCPATSAPMYRWRLVGKNIFPGLPYATTTPQIVIMRGE